MKNQEIKDDKIVDCENHKYKLFHFRNEISNKNK